MAVAIFMLIRFDGTKIMESLRMIVRGGGHKNG
jgi:hypothetical protein